MSANNSDYIDPDGYPNANIIRYEIYEERTWEIYDPMNASTIAVFNSEGHAMSYLDWLNNNLDSQ